MKHLCPYCAADNTDAMKLMQAHAPAGTAHLAALCSVCGEPIFAEMGDPKAGFRKPTWDEIKGLVENANYHQAREDYLRMKERLDAGRPTPVHELWLKFRNEILGNRPDPSVEHLIKGVFLTAYKSSLDTMEDLSECETREECQSWLRMMRAELDAVIEGEGFFNAGHGLGNGDGKVSGEDAGGADGGGDEGD